MARVALTGLSQKEITALLKKEGLPDYRVRQLIHWVYQKSVLDFHQMTDLSKTDRDALIKRFSLSSIRTATTQVSTIDQTEKRLFETIDHQTFETVLLHDRGRQTLCVSTQIGCRMACVFCATGQSGFVRNLTTAEIVEQFLIFSQKVKMDNVVLMGMGEPLDNYENVIKAIHILIDMAHFSPRRITLSTVGIVPKIITLSHEKLPIHLAVSFNAPDDVTRRHLMPTGKRYSLESIVGALRDYIQETGRRVTIEYVLFNQVNDSEKDARALVKLTKDLLCNINLIQYNVTDTLNVTESPNSRIVQFKYWLERDGRTVTIRYKRGRDIAAACGQLKASLKEKR